MIFKCRTCNKPIDEVPKLAAGMSELVFCPEWLEKGESVPSLDNGVWLRAVEVPKFGERLSLLFLPANSFFNGWSEATEEIERSAVVYAAFKKVISNDEFAAFIEISVEQVVTLPELVNHYACKKISSLLEGGYGEYSKLEFTWGAWEYYAFDAQGDVGDWRLIFMDGEGVKHLIMFYDYGFYSRHDGYAQCGNAVTI